MGEFVTLLVDTWSYGTVVLKGGVLAQCTAILLALASRRQQLSTAGERLYVAVLVAPVLWAPIEVSLHTYWLLDSAFHRPLHAPLLAAALVQSTLYLLATLTLHLAAARLAGRPFLAHVPRFGAICSVLLVLVDRCFALSVFVAIYQENLEQLRRMIP